MSIKIIILNIIVLLLLINVVYYSNDMTERDSKYLIKSKISFSDIPQFPNLSKTSIFLYLSFKGNVLALSYNFLL